MRTIVAAGHGCELAAGASGQGMPRRARAQRMRGGRGCAAVAGREGGARAQARLEAAGCNTLLDYIT